MESRVDADGEGVMPSSCPEKQWMAEVMLSTRISLPFHVECGILSMVMQVNHDGRIELPTSLIPN